MRNYKSFFLVVITIALTLMVTSAYRDATKQPDFILSCSVLDKEREVSYIDYKPVKEHGRNVCPQCEEYVKIHKHLLDQIDTKQSIIDYFEKSMMIEKNYRGQLIEFITVLGKEKEYNQYLDDTGHQEEEHIMPPEMQPTN